MRRISQETMVEKMRSRRTRNGGKHKLPDWPTEFVIQELESTAHETAVGQVAVALLKLAGSLEVEAKPVALGFENSRPVLSHEGVLELDPDIKLWMEGFSTPFLISVFTSPQALARCENQLNAYLAQQKFLGEMPPEVTLDAWLLSLNRVLLMAPQNTKPGKIRDRIRSKLARVSTVSA